MSSWYTKWWDTKTLFFPLCTWLISGKVQYRDVYRDLLVFPEILQTFSERQILWSLCSVVFHALTHEHWDCLVKLHFLWRLNSQFLCVQVKIVQISAKRAHSRRTIGILKRARIFRLIAGCVLVCWNCVAYQKTERVGTTESKVWIGNSNAKSRKPIEHILPKHLMHNLSWRCQFWDKISNTEKSNMLLKS